MADIRFLDPSLGNKSFVNQGGGGNNGGMEARIAKLEASVEYIQTDIASIKQDVRDIRADMRSDFRLLFASLIAVALGLAGLMAKGFGWL